MRLAMLTLMTVALGYSPPAQSGASAASLRGAWRVSAIGAAGSTDAEPFTQPSLYLFTDRHFSFSAITSDGPRPAFADPANPTADEMRAIWLPFMAQSGTFEVSGATLTVRPTVARNPGAMAGRATTYTLKLEGSSLTLTLQQNGAGVLAPSVRLVRVE